MIPSSALREFSRERWKVVEPLLDAALELDPNGRDGFLDQACRGDPALENELRALLAACDQGSTMLQSPAVVAFAPLLAESKQAPPTILGGRYRIVREIG